ncbi:MAG: SpoIIE family protein phosphatase [Succinivibrio sp.]|nr:SpoIIE family protein phosphatase [Succinivibrio sp.]
MSFSVSTAEKVSAYLEAVRRQATQLYPLISQPKYAPVSLFGLAYFQQGSEQSGIFYAPGEITSLSSCAKVFKLNEAEYGSGLTYINEHFGDADHFACLFTPKQAYLAYKLPKDKEGRHYVFLKKTPAEFDLPQPAYADPQKIQLNNKLKQYTFSDQTEFGILDLNGQLIYANVKDFHQELFTKELLENAKTQGTIQTLIKNGHEDLVTVSYVDQLGYGVALTPRGMVIKPAITLSFIALVGGLILLILPLYLLGRYDKFIVKHLENINSKLKEISLNNLRDPAALGPLTESLLNKETNEFTDMSNTVGNLGKSLGESLNSVINDTAKRNYAEGLSNTLHSVQQKLLPRAEDLPSSRFLDIASYLIPSRKNCGDFYDVFRLDKDNIAFLVGQISEKGAPALAIMSEIMVIARNMLKNENKRPADVLNMLNSMLIKKYSEEKIKVHIFMAILSEFTGNYIASNAGFLPPLQIKGNQVHRLAINADVELGRDEQQIYMDHKSKIDFGDILLLYTDGITEARNSEEETFGVNRLSELCEQCEDLSSADILISINKAIKTFCRDLEPTQDMSVLCIKKNGWKE